MDIGALSMTTSQTQLRQQASIAIEKKIMDTSKTQNNELLNMLNASNPAPVQHPTLGTLFDKAI